ncbi:hypothetical protein HID58_032985 [Brassica napus]|uniref:Uncharacterized protein n=1 Tax=Brassica napus TaxID=3708 RepID=A0ABQ8BXZ2_BRANA|nr:hypothetical protein HID58_032985 [Brassica napus]
MGLARPDSPPCLAVIDATVSDPPSTTQVPPSNSWKSSTDAIQSVADGVQNVAKETPVEDGKKDPKAHEPKGKKTRRGKSKEKRQWRVAEPTTDPAKASLVPHKSDQALTVTGHISLLGTAKDQVQGESSATPAYLQSTRPRSSSRASKSSNSDIQPDSSDVDTSDSELEEENAVE